MIEAPEHMEKKMTNLTQKEQVIFAAIINLMDEDTAEAQKAAEDTITATLDEVTKWTETEAKSARPVLASLIKKGLLFSAEDGSYGLTDDGIDAGFAQMGAIGAPGEAEEPIAPAKDEDEIVEAIRQELMGALAAEGATKCSALRKVASGCSEGRALFIKAAAAVGINSGTAARQWQEGRAEGGSPKAEEKTQEMKDAAFAALMGTAQDEAIGIALSFLSRRDLATIIAEYGEK